MDNESFIQPNQCKFFSFFADSPGFANQHPLMIVSYQSATSCFDLCHHTQGSVTKHGFPRTISSCCGILCNLSPQYQSWFDSFCHHHCQQGETCSFKCYTQGFAKRLLFPSALTECLPHIGGQRLHLCSVFFTKFLPALTM